MKILLCCKKLQVPLCASRLGGGGHGPWLPGSGLHIHQLMLSYPESAPDSAVCIRQVPGELVPGLRPSITDFSLSMCHAF